MSTPGFKWGIFTARLPILHMRIEWSLLLQGLVVSLSTGLALVPLLTEIFGLTFEEAVGMAMIHMMLATSHVVIFGQPFATGWITPALPLVLVYFVDNTDTPTEKFQLMCAFALDFALITLLLGVFKMGKIINDLVPSALKAGIILGAALSAFKRIFYDDIGQLEAMPVTFSVAILVCLVIFYLPAFQKLKTQSRIFAGIATYGLLPAFLLSGLLGWLNGELTFNVEMGILMPPLGELVAKASPFAIGFPPIEYFLMGFPVAAMAYLILFGDLVTGSTLISENQHHRPDDPIDLNLDHSHYIVSIRNFLDAVIVPFFPTQGVLWAGAQVLIVERWKEGRDKMQSLIGGISAFYYYGIPVMFFILPVMTFLRPFMPIALMLTLLLTGIACGKLSWSLVSRNSERLTMLVTAGLLTFYGPWIGLAVGAAMCTLIYPAKKTRI